MKLSANEEYGLRCLLRIGYEGPGGSLTLPEISQAEGVSEAYAAKIMRILRRGGFVKSARGKIGGYTLAHPAAQIVVGEVIDALGGRFFENDFCERHAGQMQTCTHSGVECSVRSLWRSLQGAVDEVLRNTTLQDLMREEQKAPVLISPLGSSRQTLRIGPADL
jgi:Rrf2 family protein